MFVWVQALLLRLSLHRRIMIFVSGILLTVFVAFGYVGWTAVNQSVSDQLGERKATALVVARHLDDLVAQAHLQLMVTAADLADLEELQPEQSAQVLQRSIHQLQYFFSYMLVIDPQLHLVGSAPQAANLKLDPEVQRILAQALNASGPGISNLVHLPVEGSYGVLFLAPVIRDGKTLGVLAAEMTIPHPAISSIASALKLGQTGHLEVIDQKGWVLASTYPEGIIDGTEHPDFYLPLLHNGQSEVGRAVHHEVKYGPTPSDGDKWHIMAFVPPREASCALGIG